MALTRQKSLSFDDIIREIHFQVMATKLPDQMKMFLVNRMSEIEYRLAQGSNDKV
jgi:DNA polymerase III delta prime subunit